MNTAVQIQPQLRPALRLVKTNTLSRDEWLEVRKHGIGSSDAAAAVGLNPYKSQLQLWMEKTGRDADLPQPDPDDTTSPVYWGTLLEPIVAASYTKQTGRRVRKVNAVLQHPERPWMLANIDREVIAAGDVQILECKTAGEFGARLWKDGVPEYVQLQVQHQLAVTGKHAADVAVLICGQQLQVHRIQRDDDLIAKLMMLQERFWHYVTSDTPPPVDGSDSAATALQCLYPRDNGDRLDFSQDSQMSALFTDLQDARFQLDKYKKLEERYKQKIQQAMGNASHATFETGSVSWKRSKDSTALDTKRLLTDSPELLAQYSLTRAGSRRFLIQA
ncbi:endonuclease [Alcaligenes faecalis]|uniref:YqaJ viral recombinase family nuclease n=1 Tax=Alcaligenes faecalis TaxID=511 RepID=UPI000A2DB286|nr:YqaJ viral recombinase family protein [Alcaligenes faecalis]OSZ45847.1 endonuclease [Alcaligenes faecalis]OSZ52830.1 endonuclease [Alcaligenes faecalis]OSZ54808.1 endonuclease [Alcaligenes faecalis]